MIVPHFNIHMVLITVLIYHQTCGFYHSCSYMIVTICGIALHRNFRFGTGSSGSTTKLAYNGWLSSWLSRMIQVPGGAISPLGRESLDLLTGRQTDRQTDRQPSRRFHLACYFLFSDVVIVAVVVAAAVRPKDLSKMLETKLLTGKDNTLLLQSFPFSSVVFLTLLFPACLLSCWLDPPSPSPPPPPLVDGHLFSAKPLRTD